MAAARRTTGYQREVASRNAGAILDAAEDLLQSQGHASISAVAAQAGVSRVTVYAHFPDWAALLEAAVERAVRRTMAALQAVHPEDGPPVEALDRMLTATWPHLARYRAMAAAVAELLSLRLSPGPTRPRTRPSARCWNAGRQTGPSAPTCPPGGW